MHIDHTNPDSIARCTRQVASVLAGLRGNLRRGAATYNRVSPRECTAMSLDTSVPEGDDALEVRLVANSDGELWLATGSVQYDTVHGVACESTELNPSDDDTTLQEMADDLVRGVADQLAMQAEE